MTSRVLEKLIARDLAALRREIEAYPDEASIWATPPGVTNSAGTLVLHLTGNLRHFIGARLGGVDFVRDRDAEFTDRNVSRAELALMIERTVGIVQETLREQSDDDLRREYPQPVAGARLGTGLFLAHLATHLAYHLGQVDYHRRLVTGSGVTIGAQSIPELLPPEDS